MLARAAGTGDWSQTALINDSTPTGRLRLITSMANTARCLGAPSGSGVPSTLSCNGPRTPNFRPVSPIAPPAFPLIVGQLPQSDNIWTGARRDRRIVNHRRRGTLHTAGEQDFRDTTAIPG